MLALALGSLGYERQDVVPSYDKTSFTVSNVSNVLQYYQIVGGNWAQITWRQAEMDAWGRCFNGVPGYLATVDDAAENAFLLGKMLAHKGHMPIRKCDLLRVQQGVVPKGGELVCT